MFWTNRLKRADADADGSWVLSYGDLMSLLLVIFVMIAAMSEMQAGEQFGRMSDGVRRAFGFAGTTQAGGERVASAGTDRPISLLDRLEQAGLRRESNVQLVGPDDEVLASCQVLAGDRGITIRMTGQASFARHSASVEPAGERALRRVAGYLIGGACRIEVRGYAEAGPLPPSVPFRDGMDLSYARARCVADVLEQGGVDRRRLTITAWADRRPPEVDSTASGASRGASDRVASGTVSDEVARGIEIVVHAEI